MEKITNVLTSIVTWITLGIAIIAIVAEELVKVFPEDGQTVAAFLLRLIVILGGILAMIRRVTPVLRSQRGLTLPKDAPPTLHLR